MNKETIQFLESLAAKLGTTGEYLWGILVRQSYVEGVTDIALALLFGTIATIYAVNAKSLYEKAKEDDSEFHFVIFFMGMIVSIVLAFMTTFFLIIGISELLNPEFYALKYILNNI
jgi:hypothetical protein